MILLVILLVIGVLLWLFLTRREGFDAQSSFALNRQWRLLWEQHTLWTRTLMISIASNSANQVATSARLFKNVSDMAAVMDRYFGSNVAGKFSNLFSAHVTIADQLISAARDNQTQRFISLKKEWFDNATQISNFLSSINTYWKRDVINEIMNSYLRLSLTEATSYLNGNFDDDINAYDAVERESLLMADMFSEGIVSRFS